MLAARWSNGGGEVPPSRTESCTNQVYWSTGWALDGMDELQPGRHLAPTSTGSPFLCGQTQFEWPWWTVEENGTLTRSNHRTFCHSDCKDDKDATEAQPLHGNAGIPSPARQMKTHT